MIALTRRWADPWLPRGLRADAEPGSGLSPMVRPLGEADDRSMNTPPGTESGGATYSGYGPPPQPPRPPRRAPWRFVRREDGKLLAGVTTGVADAFGIDVMVVRVIWVIVTLFSGGLGIVAYGICWAAFPSDQHPAPIT